MKFAQLLTKRLILLSGKGGVGKTTMAVLLALAASRLKKHALIVEMNSTERVAPFFDVNEIGYREVPLAPFVSGINLNPKDCFEEFVLSRVRFKGIFDIFINNRFVSNFLGAAPGLNEILMLGKIFELEKQKKGKIFKQNAYDLIIVDAPASGHGVSTFEVPQVLKKAAFVGPLRSYSDKIIGLLVDPEKTAFCVVTMPEEMPVVESCELITQVRQKLQIPMGLIFMNQFHESQISNEEVKIIEKEKITSQDSLYPYFVYSKLDYQRAQLNQYYYEELLKKDLGLEIIQVPRIYKKLNSSSSLKELVNNLMELTHD